MGFSGSNNMAQAGIYFWKSLPKACYIIWEFASVFQGVTAVRKFWVMSLLAAICGILVSTSQGSIIVESASYSPVVKVDQSSATRSLSVLGAGTIADVNVLIDFTKSDDPIADDGTPVGTNFSFSREIVFKLISPLGTIVDLVNEDTYSGQTPGARVSVTFDDSAASQVGGPSLISGAFRPVSPLSAFVNELAFGNWTLFVQDTVGSDPLSLNAWTLTITTNDNGVVPELSSILTWSVLCCGGVGIAVRKKLLS